MHNKILLYILNGGQVGAVMKQGRPELFERREPGILNSGQVGGVMKPELFELREPGHS